MAAVCLAVFYALFVWWFSTGLVLLLVLRRGAIRLSLIGAAALYPLSLLCLAWSSKPVASVGTAYLGFTAAVVLWGTIEVSFLTGVVTGPRPLPCPPSARGLARLGFAVRAILWHELVLAATGAAVLALTWSGRGHVGALTFLVLWAMRISAKLNLFLGVPVLNDEAMPDPIAHLRSYFCRAPASGFFPVAFVAASIAAVSLIAWALDAGASRATVVGDVLVASLLALALLEHVFMIVPLPIERLWRWSANAAERLPSRKGRARPIEASLDPLATTSS